MKKILVAEDDRTSRVLLARTLERWGYEVVAVGDGEDAWTELAEGKARLVISDWEMPRLDGPGLCRRARQRSGPYLYILLLTQHSDSERIVAGLEAGADDYVTKPFVPAELQARLGVGRRFLSLHDELHQRYQQIARANEQLSLIAATDPLMNIGNRRRFESAMAEAQHRAQGYGFLMVDIDHFKSVNDRHGHAVGDRVLACVAQALRGTLPPGGEAFRYGGEEIGVMVPAAADGALLEIGERLRAAVAALEIDLGQGDPLRVSASFGAAPSATGLDWRTVVERGDAAMYLAKRQGRNRVVVWSPEQG
jgi:two-component system cell cycle response regulator